MRVVANRAAETITVNVPSRFSSLIVELPVQQIGSGDPSPENIRPITQWTDVALYVAGTDTAVEPTVTTTFPTPIFGGMVDVARGEVASLYNEKKSASGWEMVEEGQFRCQVGAFNNGDETSTNVADLYSSHYKTVSNKDAYDATDDLTCGTPTIEGVTYLYVNDLDYSTLEDFTAYIGDVQFVYKSHVPMSDVIDPTIVYLSEGTSYVWAEGAFYVETVTGTPPLSLPNSLGKPLKAWEVGLEPYQDLHGHDHPWPAGGGKNKFYTTNITETGATVNGVTFTRQADGTVKAVGTSESGDFRVLLGSVTLAAGSYTVSGAVDSTKRFRLVNREDTLIAHESGSGANFTLESDATVVVYIRLTETVGTSINATFKPMICLSSATNPTIYAPYSNICPILGTDKLNVFVEESYDPSATPKTVITIPTLSANQWDIANVQDGYIDDADGEVKTIGIAYKNTGYIEVQPSTSYYVCTQQTAAAWGAWYDADKSYITGVTGYASGGNPVITSPSNAKYVRLTISSNSTGNPNTFAFNYPSTVTTYNPFSKTLYGGTYDAVTGVGTIDRVMWLGRDLSWSKVDGSQYRNFVATPINGVVYSNTDVTIISSIYKGTANNYASADDDNYVWPNSQQPLNRIAVKDTSKAALTADEFKAAIADVQFVCQLQTPIPFSTDGHTITTPKGNAYTWATAEDGTVDNLEVQYIRIAEQES